jgi:putative ABC transport system permease protein
MTWSWAWRDLFRHRGRTLLALLGVGVSAALLLDMMMLSGGIERSFERLLLSRGYQLRVSPSGTLPFDTEATVGDVTALVSGIRADPEVEDAGAILGLAVQAKSAAGTAVSLVGYGVQPEAQGIYVLESGRDIVPGDSNGVVLGLPAAIQLGASVGDTLRFFGRLDPQTAAPGAERSLVVRGVVRFLYDARDQPSVALTLDVARWLAGPAFRDRASVLMVRVAEGPAPATVAARLQREWPAVGISSVDDLVVQFRLRLTYFRQLSLILGAIALVVTVLLVGTLLTITVHERLPEIATLRALGVARRTILLQVLAQGAVLTIGGGMLGLVLGLITARWLDTILTAFPGLPASVSFFVAAPRPLALAALTLALTGLLAGLWPAWQAARAPIAHTLRQEAT